ncbi:hypothetical protein [Bacterioplanoides sp.]|uniref:hypothetical protein n=1 Tax=Bacterioplanoides sp. TaxID=2066072 RepID=UPI003B5CEF81
MLPDKERQLIRYWLKENQSAIDLVNAYSAVSQIWDDLHDGDKAVTKSRVNQMMTLALIDIPTSPFFREHYLELMPVVQHCLMTWLDANTLEAVGDDRDLQVSYIIRSVTTDLIIHVAGIVGGPVWRRQAALAIRQAIYHDNEPFEAYYAEVMKLRQDTEEESDVQ